MQFTTFVFYSLLLLATIGNSTSFDKVSLPLETGYLTLDNAWNSQSDDRQTDFFLPLSNSLDQNVVIGMKTFEIDQRNNNIFQQKHQVTIWISQENKRIKCNLRQVGHGLLRFQVSYLKLNFQLLQYIHIMPHFQINDLAQTHFKGDNKIQIMWSEQSNKNDVPDLKHRFLEKSFKSVALLNGFTLEKRESNMIFLSLEVEKTNITHLTFKNHFQGVQEISFSLLVFNEIDMFINLISYDIQNIAVESWKNQNEDIISNSMLFLKTYVKQVSQTVKNFQIQTKQRNKRVSLSFWKISCPYEYFWNVQLDKCTQFCPNNMIDNNQVCLLPQNKRESQQVIRKNQKKESSSTEIYSQYRLLQCRQPDCTIIPYCLGCAADYTRCSVYCTGCVIGYYLFSSGNSCKSCPTSCTTCYSYVFGSKTYITCTGCLGNLTLIGSNPQTCGCLSTQYMSGTYCYDCPIGCATCVSAVNCTTCTQGYYFSNYSCVACLPVCKTCIGSTTCTSCDTSEGLVLNSLGICVCPSPTFLDPVSLKCLNCSSFYSNCLSCNYNLVYDPVNPVPIICTSAASGYYLSSGVPLSCTSYCATCTNGTSCTSTGCLPTFTYNPVTGQCTCTNYLTNTSPQYCDTCSNIITGCLTCTTTSNLTTCQTCNTNYYSSTGTLPTSSCLPCLSTCTSCTNSTGCTACVGSMTLNTTNGQCLCPSGSYLNSITLLCDTCSAVIPNCLTCASTVPTTCLTSVTGTYISANGTTVIACDLNCNTCTSSGCTVASPGYAINTTNSSYYTVYCSAACSSCLTAIAYCTYCTASPALTCTSCQSGYYLSGSTCSACMSPGICLRCVDGTSCIVCQSPFIVSGTTQCVCNATAGMYLTLNGSSCALCSTIFPNCTTCTTSGTTTCSICNTGMIFNGTSCVLCAFPCATCNGLSNTNCLTCLGQYSYSAGQCTCDNTLQMWYSNITQDCVTCATIIPNCLICQARVAAPTITDCQQCATSYYVDPATGTCSPCDITCTDCTGIGFCTTCVNNLVVVGGYCVPNTASDPNLALYGPTETAVSCLALLTNCLICSPSPLACSSCQSGTFLNGTICQNCPTTCATCDITGCLTCPTGLTQNGSACICISSCTICSNEIADCLTCSVTGNTVNSCLSCQAGTYLQNGICNSCPTGCAICTSSTTCTLCLQTFTLIGGTCSCDASLDLYPNGQVCQLCSDIYYGCTSCSISGTTTVCLQTQAGFYVTSTGSTSPCAPSCATCTNATLCTSCPSGQTLAANYTCICATTCITCNTASPNCVSCDMTLLGAFSKCTSCAVGYYLTTTGCVICPSASNCVTCESGGLCTSCSFSFQVVGGVCQCNSAKGMILNTATGVCQSCSGNILNCIYCLSDSTSSTGYSCGGCLLGYYLLNNTCHQEICGDGIVSTSEQCDDGNNRALDGCYQCKIESTYACTGSPSLCFMNTAFKITFDSLTVSSTTCNKLTINLLINPYSSQFDSADFNKMLMSYKGSKITSQPSKTTYKEGIVSYSFSYYSKIEGDQVKFYFMPSQLNVPSTASIGLYPLFVNLTSDNSVLLRYYSEDVCSKKNSVTAFVNSVKYLSYVALIFSAVPAKIVGLELFGVLQLSFLTLGNIDHLNPLLASFTQFSGTNGLNVKLDSKQKTYMRRLQQTALTPSRVQTIGYASNFLRNCNIMLILVHFIILVAFVLYLLIYFIKKCAPTLYSLSKRILKEVLLTLILFNCFNFSYSSGLHFAYADHNYSLYALGTLAALTTIIIPLVMVVVLQFTQQEGFGQFKEKMKKGWLEKSYFTITIIYRMGVGYYTATMNQNQLSTLKVLALSLFFLVYNLVNLPFHKAYHNYRANICHITQFICLFVGMYYRSMKSTSPVDQANSIYGPVYLQIVAITLSLTVSVAVLVYQVYIWVGQLRRKCCKKGESEQKEEASLSKMDKMDDLKNEQNKTVQNFQLQIDEEVQSKGS